jgi:exopolysaccharide biosynthesis polyprenyl glycosylphosphotransferase
MPDPNKIYHYSGASKTDIDGRNITEHRALLRFVKLIDVILVSIPFILAWYYFYSHDMIVSYYRLGNIMISFLYILLYYLISHLYHGYLIHINSISEIIFSQTISAILSNFVMYIVIWLLIFKLPNPLALLLALGIQIIAIILWSLFSHKWYFHHFPPKKAVIIYDEKHDLDNLTRESSMMVHFDVKSIVNIHDFTFDSENASMNASMEDELTDQKISQFIGDSEVVFLSGLHSHERNQIIKYCVANDIVAYTLPRIGDIIMQGAEKLHLAYLPVLSVRRYNPTPEYLFIKRLFDILISIIFIVLLSPLMIVLALIIRSDGGPAIYKQERLTKDGRIFRCYKFRSMRVDAEKDGIARLSTGENDPRITKIGRFMRSHRLDELPQLFNIIKGDMSLVGPRPERPEIAATYKEILPEFDLRLQCKCGLTGYAQVYGKYNTTPYDKLLFDLMYISKPSFVEDFKIILATFKILFMKDSTEGVAEGQTTASAESLVNTEDRDAEKM